MKGMVHGLGMAAVLVVILPDAVHGQPPAAFPAGAVRPIPEPSPAAGLEPPSRPAVPPRNTGPAARAHSRVRRGRHGTMRTIRRTPEVMREDAARVKRGDLFSTWSNEYLE